MRFADMMAMRRAKKRMGKLTKQLARRPDDRDIKAELWLRCRQFHRYGTDAYGWNPPLGVTSDFGRAILLGESIEEELGLAEIVDRIEHLIDSLEAKVLREQL